MASYGSLIYYTKAGPSQPYLLSYGKTTIGPSESHHIRIKGKQQISCVLDSNEIGVTILVNENEDENVFINNLPTSKYTVLKHGDYLEFGNIKFQYSNPTLKEEFLEQTQHTLNKKVGIVRKAENFTKLNLISTTPLKRSQGVGILSKQSRFSTGSGLTAVKNSPRNAGFGLSSAKHMSTPQSPSRASVSRRMASRNSTLAAVSENEVFDVRSPKATPVKVSRRSFLATGKSLSSKKNRTFAGTSDFSSPILARNKTYSGNVSDVSENITTPENNVTVASITPLNVSKKSVNRSRTLSTIGLPSSSTPKSAMKINRSSSLYRPLVEDITPASPLPRSSLRNSSLKKQAFTQRRSVNFNISSSSDLSSSRQDSDVNGVFETSGSKRKRSIETEEVLETSGNLKKRRRNSSRLSLNSGHATATSLHDPSTSGIQNLSNANQSKNEQTNTSTSSRSRRNTSIKDKEDSEGYSIVSWNVEVSSSEMNLSGLSDISSLAETPVKSRKSMRLSSSFVSDSSVDKLNRSAGRRNISQTSDLDESQHSELSSEIVSSNTEAILDESLEDSSERSESVKTGRFSTTRLNKGKVRSRSLNLNRKTPQSVKKLSKTMGNISTLGISEESLINISSTPTVPTKSGRVSSTRKSSVSERSSRSLNTGNKSLALDFSPIVPDPRNNFSGDFSRRSIETQGKGKGITRSKSLTLRRDDRRMSDKHSKTLGSNLKLNNIEKSSLANVSFKSETESSIIDSKRKSTISKPRSKSLNVRNERSTSLNVNPKISTSMIVNFSSTTPNQILSSEDNESDSFMSTKSMSELNISSGRRSRSGRVSNAGDSSTVGSPKQKTPSIVISRSSSLGGNAASPVISRVSTRGRSQLLSEDTSEFSSVSSNMSFGNSSLNGEGLESSTDKAIFKTPTVKRAPRRLEATPNLSFESVNNVPTSAESRRSARSSKRVDNSFSDMDEIQSVDTSLNGTWQSVESEISESGRQTSRLDSSVEVRSAKSTPQNIKNISKNQKTPNSDLTEMAVAEKLLNLSKNKLGKLKSTPKMQNSPKNDLTDIRGVKRLLKTPRVKKSPKNDLSNIAGVKKLLRTPKVQKSPKNDLSAVGGIKKLLKTPGVQRAPKNDLSDVRGVKKLLKTPKVQNSPRNDLSNIGGVKKLLKTPKAQKSPENDLTNVGGVKKLLKTPKVQKSPKNDLTNVKGVKKLMKSPTVQKSPKNDLTNVGGVKKLMKSPKVQRSPKNDLRNIVGVKKLMKSPRVQKSPKNDLTNVAGVKRLMKSPRVQKSPKNDLTNIGGVKKLMTTPKLQKSPINDLTKVSGLKKLMSPKQHNSPKNDLGNVKGVKKFMKTPRVQKSPRNDLLDVRGIRNLLRTPKNKSADESHDLSGIDILFNESQESAFDKLLDRTPLKTYARSPKVNKSHEEVMKKPETPEHVLKWIEEQSITEPNTQITESKRGKRKLVDVKVTPNKRKKTARSTRTNKNESLLDISSNILEKPSSTPNLGEKTSQNRSKAEISDSVQIDEQPKTTRTLRGKRKLESDQVAEDESTRTRGRKAKKIEIDNTNEADSITSVDKKTLRTRQTKQKDHSVEQPIVETTTKRRGRKPKEALDSNDNNEEIAEKQPKKPTRGRKATKTNVSVEEAKEIPEKSLEIDNKSEQTQRGRRTKKAKEEEIKTDNVEKEIQPEKRGRRNKKIEEKNDEIEDDSVKIEKESSSNKRSKNIKKDETEDSKKKSVKTSKKETKENESNLSKEENPEPQVKKGTRRAKTQITEEKTKTTSEDESVEIRKESNSNKRNKKSKKNEAEENKDDSVSPNKKNGKKTEIEDPSPSNEDKPETQVKKNTRRAKTEITSEEKESTKSTRSNKGRNKKYSEEEWHTPVKKNDKKQAVTFKDEIEYLKTPLESITVNGRSLRRKKVVNYN